MSVSEIAIRDFRNLAAVNANLPDTGAVIIGENGHGKTNFLEALYYLVIFRSLRGAKDSELVRFGAPGFFVAGTSSGVRVTAGYEAATKRKKVTLDGTPVTRLGEAVGRVLAVSFSPADRAIVAGGPAERRRYLDVLLSLGSSSYLEQLARFRSALRQRNAALRRGHLSEATVFDAPLTAAATRVAEARLAWTERWSARFTEVCQTLGEQVPPTMRYVGHGWSPAGGATELDRMLAVSRERDVRRGVTTVGPHRDDLRLLLADRELRVFGSAGQQRTAAVALRLVEAETLADATSRPPMGLYDDVFAELDENRQRRLLELIQESMPGQAFVTAPRDTEVPSALFRRPRWTMQGGCLAQS